MIVERTVRLMELEEDDRFGQENLSLSDFESDPGYVLIGEPGIGKTTALEKAARAENSTFVSARHFISRDLTCHPEWEHTTLFIDGLDEVRIGGGDPRAAMDKTIARLEKLGKPKFRLSCRSGSWLGEGDLRELSSLMDSQEVPVLQLNPLNYHEAQRIVSQWGGNATTFIPQALEHGLETFLGNPQLLDILYKSVAVNGWPDSLGKTFESACRELVKERNPEHCDAHSFESKRSSTEAVLSAAGQLFALMLIANKSGWSVEDMAEDPEVLSLCDVHNQDRIAVHAAFDSSLFQGPRHCRVPIHRLTAEFLAARYLAEIIRNGLLPRRVLALLMGYDGVPFSDLRGLTGWLAAVASETRMDLIHADPLAVAFNGDASSFHSEERKILLEKLEQKIHLGHTWPSASSLGALAGKHGLSAVRELTSSPLHSDNRQTLVYWLLCGVLHTQPDPGKKSDSGTQMEADRRNLWAVIYNSGWKSNVRCIALRVLSQIITDESDRSAALQRLVKDLDEGRLPDEKSDLRGTVLDLLYPGELQTPEVWNYLVTGNADFQSSAYRKFWDGLVDRSTDEQIKELLDSLYDRASEVIPKLAHHSLANIVLRLLARGVELYGDQLDILKLYRWFELVEWDDHFLELNPVHSPFHWYSRDTEASTAIYTWLHERKEIRYALMEHALTAQESMIHDRHAAGRKFVGKNPPAGFRSWCLMRAGKLWNAFPKAAEVLAQWSVREQEGWEPPLSDKEIAGAVQGIAELSQWNTGRLRHRALREREERQQKKNLEETRRAFQDRKQEELAQIRHQEPELAAGKCDPALLDDLARIYFDGLARPGAAPGEYLQSCLGGDQALLRAALAGFRSMLDRDDLPDLDQIAQLYEDGRRSRFARPFLAGMEEEERETGQAFDRLSDEKKRRAAGFFLVTDLPRRHVPLTSRRTHPDLPGWHLQSLTAHPEVVADSLVAIHNATVRRKTLPREHLFKVASDPAYASVAELAVSRMFTVFPTRCSAPQLDSLRVVLWSALSAHGMSAGELRKITLKRLNRKRMDTGQRALWLCTGLFVARDHCLPRLTEFLSGGSEVRLRHMMSFLVRDSYGQSILQNFDGWCAKDILRLIRVFGEKIRPPVDQKQVHLLEPEEVRSHKPYTLVVSWLHALAKRSDDRTAYIFSELVSAPDLAAWKHEISQYQEMQARRLRAEQRVDLSLEQIQWTLQNSPPSSAADLAAITVEVLERLANRIRNGETNDWCQYWHRDPKTGTPPKPLHENDCRDVFLSDMQKMLRDYRIDAQPEGRYAEEKRTDIRVSYGSDIAVPIEIKKNSDRRIWRGISEQLVPKYTRDPRADSYGIYLVFWFGPAYMRIVPPEGDIPDKPGELKILLEKLSDPERGGRIRVVVIDVSPVE